mmetsp:Transcript_26214/g.68859  ORF Transcript_26214/g.68859 Transcript_26214/m.68859 type:complete len:271 (-) Transcript_26214:1666-2478(-)
MHKLAADRRHLFDGVHPDVRGPDDRSKLATRRDGLKPGHTAPGHKHHRWGVLSGRRDLARHHPAVPGGAFEGSAVSRNLGKRRKGVALLGPGDSWHVLHPKQREPAVARQLQVFEGLCLGVGLGLTAVKRAHERDKRRPLRDQRQLVHLVAARGRVHLEANVRPRHQLLVVPHDRHRCRRERLVRDERALPHPRLGEHLEPEPAELGRRGRRHSAAPLVVLGLAGHRHPLERGQRQQVVQRANGVLGGRLGGGGGNAGSGMVCFGRHGRR